MRVKMSKFSSSTIAMTMLIAPVLNASTAVAAEKWDLPTGYPAANFHTLNIQDFASCVAKGTADGITIAVHPNGVLFKAADIKRAVQTGQAFIGERLLSAHEKENAMFGTDSIPFLANTYDDSVKLFASARPELDKVLEGQGLKLLYSVPWPPQGLYFKQQVNSVADMKGIAIRSYNKATQRIAELTGMVPVQIEAAETSQALAAGVINALITSAVTGVDTKAWEQTKYFYKVEAWMPRNHVIINKAKYDGLDDQAKTVLKDCSAVAEAAGLDKSKAANDTALKTLADNGIQVVVPSDALKAELAVVGKTMTEEWLVNAGETGKTVLDGFKK
jgi:TRAP-type C4-dicarboxylate transport system substrate-binding protein